MKKQFIKDAFGWGVILWLVGYILGIVLFMVVPHQFIGWVIMPIGIGVTMWVLLRKIHAFSFAYYFSFAIVWTVVAIVCDYFFLVKLFNPEDGYYKLDVYIYYILTFVLPLLVGWSKKTTT